MLELLLLLGGLAVGAGVWSAMGGRKEGDEKPPFFDLEKGDGPTSSPPLPEKDEPLASESGARGKPVVLGGEESGGRGVEQLQDLLSRAPDQVRPHLLEGGAGDEKGKSGRKKKVRKPLKVTYATDEIISRSSRFSHHRRALNNAESLVEKEKAVEAREIYERTKKRVNDEEPRKKLETNIEDINRWLAGLDFEEVEEEGGLNFPEIIIPLTTQALAIENLTQGLKNISEGLVGQLAQAMAISNQPLSQPAAPPQAGGGPGGGAAPGSQPLMDLAGQPEAPAAGPYNTGPVYASGPITATGPVNMTGPITAPPQVGGAAGPASRSEAPSAYSSPAPGPGQATGGEASGGGVAGGTAGAAGGGGAAGAGGMVGATGTALAPAPGVADEAYNVNVGYAPPNAPPTPVAPYAPGGDVEAASISISLGGAGGPGINIPAGAPTPGTGEGLNLKKPGEVGDDVPPPGIELNENGELLTDGWTDDDFLKEWEKYKNLPLNDRRTGLDRRKMPDRRKDRRKDRRSGIERRQRDLLKERDEFLRKLEKHKQRKKDLEEWNNRKKKKKKLKPKPKLDFNLGESPAAQGAPPEERPVITLENAVINIGDTDLDKPAQKEEEKPAEEKTEAPVDEDIKPEESKTETAPASENGAEKFLPDPMTLEDLEGDTKEFMPEPLPEGDEPPPTTFRMEPPEDLAFIGLPEAKEEIYDPELPALEGVDDPPLVGVVHGEADLTGEGEEQPDSQEMNAIGEGVEASDDIPSLGGEEGDYFGDDEDEVEESEQPKPPPQEIHGILELKPPEEDDAPFLTLTYDFAKIPDSFQLSRDYHTMEYAYYKYKPMLVKAQEFTRRKMLKNALNYYRVIKSQNIPPEFKRMINRNIQDITEYLEKFLMSRGE